MLKRLGLEACVDGIDAQKVRIKYLCPLLRARKVLM
jgi:hypothetical protein